VVNCSHFTAGWSESVTIELLSGRRRSVGRFMWSLRLTGSQAKPAPFIRWPVVVVLQQTTTRGISAMARTSRAFSRRQLGAVLGGLALTVAVAGCGTPAVSDGPDAGAGSADADQIVACTSGPFTGDGVETSSTYVYRLPAGEPVPAGCRLV
jgi:hypothetical protein